MASSSQRLGWLFLLSFVVFLTLQCHGLGAEALTSEHGSAASVQRHLLQAKKPCSVQFAGVDFSPLTSTCNPNTTARDICCNAFLSMTCPYAPLLNDLTTSCSTDYFDYLDYAGKYPQGFFANTCQYLGDRNNGLPCPSTPAPAPSPNEARPLQLGLVALMAGVGVHLVFQFL